MPLSWQAASAHKPCEQTPHMGDEKSQGTRKDPQQSKKRVRSLAHALSCGLLHLQLEMESLLAGWFILQDMHL